MMERWIGTKEGVHIAVVEAWNIAVRAATGTTHLLGKQSLHHLFAFMHDVLDISNSYNHSMFNFALLGSKSTLH